MPNISSKNGKNCWLRLLGFAASLLYAFGLFVKQDITFIIFLNTMVKSLKFLVLKVMILNLQNHFYSLF